MNFMWDMAIRAGEQGRPEQELFFCQAKEYSPFFEPAFPCLNETKVETGRIELNLLYRFADIFQDILAWEGEDRETGAYARFREFFIDAVLHAILYTDLRDGLTRREVSIRKIQEELLDGSFFRGAAGDFAGMDAGEQYRLASLVLSQMETGSSLGMFRRALKILYPKCLLYQFREDGKKLILYIGMEGTETEKSRFRFVETMFLPVGYELKVFWKYHFGIVGIEGTMRLGETALYE